MVASGYHSPATFHKDDRSDLVKGGSRRPDRARQPRIGSLAGWNASQNIDGTRFLHPIRFPLWPETRYNSSKRAAKEGIWPSSRPGGLRYQTIPLAGRSFVPTW